MATLRIDLQAGFDDDAVRVRLDGRDLLAHDGVTTDYSSGLATSDEHTDVEPGDHELEVLVPSRSMARRKTITVTDHTYAAVAIEGDEITVATHTEPLRYF